MADNNLWPDFGKIEKIPLPKSLMKEQANFLTEKTKKAIVGQVTTGTYIDGSLHHDFRLVVPALNNYIYELFIVNQDPIIVYPATVYWQGKSISVKDNNALLDQMKTIFSAESTQKVIVSILSQVDFEKPA